MSNLNQHYCGLINRYRDRLPVNDDTRIVTLNEGNTPLIKLENIPKLIGKEVTIYVKFEGLNPTGSFKDRGMTLVDFKLEFGIHHNQLILADEISPDTCRIWDAKTGDVMDKDRFRKDMGKIEEAYQEVLKRVCG